MKKFRNSCRAFLIFVSKIITCFTVCAYFTFSLEKPCSDLVSKKTNIIVGFYGTSAQDPDVLTLKKALHKGKIAGFILYGRNIVNPKQLKSLISFLKKDAPRAIVAIDQEGGMVARLKTEDGFIDSGAMLAAADYKNVKQVMAYHRRAAREMRQLGINMVFGPVADLNTNPNCPIIGQKRRSFSDNPDIVAEYCNAIIAVYKKNGIKACIKHAPGHGSATTDSHLGASDVSDTWDKRELIPFIMCSKKHPGVAIMMAHVFNRTLDPKFPASMSQKTINRINRDLKKSGANVMPLYVTDAYEMKAISDKYTPKEFLDHSKKIGINLVLLFCDNGIYGKEYRLQNFLIEKLHKKL
jgi:beta-N-acetylhexosaminidase